ncbi:MAG: hypothetical protein AAF219_07005 [Myxococcota bacterium]
MTLSFNSWFDNRSRLRALLSLVVAAPLILTGCGDDEGEENGAPTDGPLFALSTQIFGGSNFDEVTSFVVLAESLDSGEASLDNALEVGGGAIAYAPDGGSEFYLVSGETLSVTKYGIDANGSFEQRGRLGLSGAGVSLVFGESMVFEGLNRGFLFELNSGQIIELDLDAMEIANTIDATALLDATQPTFVDRQSILRRDGRFVGVAYATDSIQETVSSVSTYFEFDPATGVLETRPAPCGGLANTVEADNGDLYLSTEAFTASIHRVDPSRAPAPCMVRLPAGSDTFDAPIALNDLTGGPTAGIIPSTETTGLLRVLSADTVVTETTTGIQLFSTPSWETWRVTLESSPSATEVTAPELAGGIRYYAVGEDAYQNSSLSDFSATELQRTSGGDSPETGVTVPGIPFSVFRLR